MREPNLRTSRLVIAGGFAAAMAIGIGGFLVGRATAPTAEPPATIPTRPTAAASPEPKSPSVLRRADIIALAASAADAAASGLPLPQSVLDLGGRRFELAIPFGCDGPATPDNSAALRWRYDAGDRTFRAHVTATRWTLAEWGLADSPVSAGAAEGFWLDRPWSSSETCPERETARESEGVVEPAVPAASPEIPAGQALAIAEFDLSEAAPKMRRAARTFDTVKRVEPDQIDTSRGLRLRLTGRIEKLPGGQPVRCTQAGAQQRPVCAVAALFEEAAVESAASGQVIAAWSLGQPLSGD